MSRFLGLSPPHYLVTLLLGSLLPTVSGRSGHKSQGGRIFSLASVEKDLLTTLSNLLLAISRESPHTTLSDDLLTTLSEGGSPHYFHCAVRLLGVITAARLNASLQQVLNASRRHLYIDA